MAPTQSNRYSVCRTIDRGSLSAYDRPHTSRPFPLFTGELFLEAVSTRGSLSLRLHGNYAPPPAFLGHDVIGNRLAVATAHELLLALRDFIERDLRIERARDRSKHTMASYEVSATLE